MTNEQLTQKTMEQEADIARNTADIDEIFRQQKKQDTQIEENSKMLSIIHSLVIEMTEVKCSINDLKERFEDIENDRKQKSHAIWQIVVSAVVGGALTFLVTQILGG